MKIVQIPRRFVRSDWGGTETVILETCKRLLVEHETEVLCPNALSDIDVETIDTVRVKRVPYFYPYFGLDENAKMQLDKKGGNLFSFELMRELKKMRDLDIIHIHTGKRLGGIARHVARKKRIPYVISLHGGVFDVPTDEAASWTAPTEGKLEWGKLLGAWVGSRRVMDDAAAIICVGQQEQKETSARFPNKKVIHLANGVDPDKFAEGNGGQFRRKYKIPIDAFLMLSMGRIDPQKNQLFPIEMMSQLLKDKPDLHLLLIGHVTNQKYQMKLQDSIARFGLQDKVTIIPGVDAQSNDLVDAYHAADLFCLPSIHEPFGIVILEAWAAGLPVIASSVGGIPSFVSDGEDGVLFESNDAESFVKAFQKVANNPQFAEDIRRAGQKKAVTQYSWEQITNQLISIYEEAIRENPLR